MGFDRGFATTDQKEDAVTTLARLGEGRIVVGGKSDLDVMDLAALPISDATRDFLGAPTDPERTISIVGDLHEGYTGRAGNAARLDATFADLATLRAFCAHRLYVGDLVERAGSGASGTTPGENDTAILSRITGLDSDRDTWDAAVGNHDLATGRAADDWATIYGYDDQNWTRTLDFCRIVSVGADDNTTYSDRPQTLSAETVTWLDEQLALDGRDTIVLSHGPLQGTVASVAPWGAFSGGYAVSNENYPTYPHADILAVLDKHPHVRAWVSGHSHSGYEDVGAIIRYWTGSRHIAYINAGAINWVDYNVSSEDDPVRSLFVTMLDDRIEVRIRNHREAAWEPHRGRYAYELPRIATPPEGNPTAFVYPLDNSLDGDTMDGPDTLNTSGSPTFDTVSGEYALDLDSSSKYAYLDARGLMMPAQGSLVAKCSFGASEAPYQYIFYQAAINDASRIYLRRQGVGDHRLVSMLGGPAAAPLADDAIADDEVVVVALDWGAGEQILRINGRVIARAGYFDFEEIGSMLSIGRSGSSTNILGSLFGVAGFRRMLTSEEHMRLVNTPSDDWAIDTVLG